MRHAACGLMVLWLWPVAAEASVPAQIATMGGLMPMHRHRAAQASPEAAQTPARPRFFPLPQQNGPTMMPLKAEGPKAPVLPQADAKNALSEEDAKLLLSIFSGPD